MVVLKSESSSSSSTLATVTERGVLFRPILTFLLSLDAIGVDDEHGKAAEITGTQGLLLGDKGGVMSSSSSSAECLVSAVF